MTRSTASQVVAGEAELALEPPGAATERQPGHSGGRHPAAGRGKPVRLGGPVEVAPRRRRPDGAGARRGVDLDGVHRGACRSTSPPSFSARARDAVPAGRTAISSPRSARSASGRGHVIGGPALGDQRRALVDHRVEDRCAPRHTRHRPARSRFRGTGRSVLLPPPVTPFVGCSIQPSNCSGPGAGGKLASVVTRWAPLLRNAAASSASCLSLSSVRCSDFCIWLTDEEPVRDRLERATRLEGVGERQHHPGRLALDSERRGQLARFSGSENSIRWRVRGECSSTPLLHPPSPGGVRVPHERSHRPRDTPPRPRPNESRRPTRAIRAGRSSTPHVSAREASHEERLGQRCHVGSLSEGRAEAPALAPDVTGSPPPTRS